MDIARKVLKGDRVICMSNDLGPLYLHGLTIIHTWISNRMHDNVWDITFPFPNFRESSGMEK